MPSNSFFLSFVLLLAYILLLYISSNPKYVTTIFYLAINFLKVIII